MRNLLLSLIPSLVSLFQILCFYRLRRTPSFWLSIFFFAVGVFSLLYYATNLHLRNALLLALGFNLLGVSLYIWSFVKIFSRRLTDSQNRFKDEEANHLLEENRGQKLQNKLESTKTEIDRMIKLYGVVKGLGEALSWNEMIRHIDYAVHRCMGFKEFQLFLLDESNSFQKVLTRGVRLQEFPISSSPDRIRIFNRNAEAYLENSIFQGDLKIGILRGRLTPEQIAKPQDRLMQETNQVSEELAMGLQKARLFSWLEKLSRIDGLTGVHRREIFNERLNDEVRRARVFKTRFSILIGDLDHFKQINDSFGHQAGDEVLRRTGKLLKESVYETDFVARYGGEEFVILFPQADPVGVQRKAESLREKIMEEKFMMGWNTFRVTISLGISHFPEDSDDPVGILKVADTALYAAKEGGRNRVIDSSFLK